ncbi:hypothetical protein MYA_3517 [Burkholderia sp. KJ006]|nr:hypothetical protein MYA_3517 [Burkholderia sp. KJ006]
MGCPIQAARQNGFRLRAISPSYYFRLGGPPISAGLTK